MDSPADPHVVVGSHPELGYVALNGGDHFVADHILKSLGFQPVPGSKLYALADPQRDGAHRAQQAIASLRAARYQVAADLALDPPVPAPDQPARNHNRGHGARPVQAEAPRAAADRAAPARTTPAAQAALARSAAWQSRTDLKPLPPRPKHPPLWSPRSQLGR